jgi:RNA-directed DNA polymerase
MNILESIWVSVFIRHTYACVKGRGIHATLRDIKRDMKDVDGTKYCLKLDIRKFYPSIDHDVMKMLIRKKIKDSRMLELLDGIIDSAEGLPIGNYLSQYLANLFLSYMDHWAKEILRVKYYYRYADDIVILAANKPILHELRAKISEYLTGTLKLEMKGNYQVFPVDVRGVDFVGYVFRHTHILMRKAIKQSMCRRAAVLNRRQLDPADYKRIISPYIGWASHCNTKNLIKKVIDCEKIL